MNVAQSAILASPNRRTLKMTYTIHQSADEVVSRYGPASVDYVNDRIEQMMSGGMSREVDQAYLLLNEVERLLAQRPH